MPVQTPRSASGRAAASRRADPPNPPSETLDAAELLGDQNGQDVREFEFEFEDRPVGVEEEEAEGDAQAGRAFREAVRSATRDPHINAHSGRRPAPKNGPLAIFGDGGGVHAKWLVEHEDPMSGRMVLAGYVPADTTSLEFCQRFIALMPSARQPAKTFYLTPLSAANEKLHAQPYAHPTFDALTEDVVRVREMLEAREEDETVGMFGAPGGGRRGGGYVDPALAALAAQNEALLAQMRAMQEREEARQRALDEERNRLTEERISAATTVGADYSEGYRRLMADSAEAAKAAREVATSGMTDVLKTQRELEAAERETKRLEREEERRRADRDHELRLAQIKADADLRKAEAEKAIELAKANVEAERVRMREEREAAREERRDREAREAAAAEKEAERQRKHEEKMEELRREERRDREKREEEERERRDEHAKAMVALYTRDTQAASPLALFEHGKALLQAVGIEPKDVLSTVRAVMAPASDGEGAGGGAMVAGINLVKDILVEVIKRVPVGSEDEDEDEDGEEEDEVEDEGQVVQHPPKQARQVEPPPTRPAIEQKPTAPGPEAFLKREPAAVAPTSPVPTTTPAESQGPEMLPAARKAGREAVLKLIDAVDEKPPGEWPALVLEVSGASTLIDYLSKVGVRRALADADRLDLAPTVQAVLTNMGLLAPTST